MNPTYKDGKLSLNLADVLETLDTDDKIQLMQALSCESDIIEYVTQQIIQGWTTDGYHGGKGYEAYSYPHGLDKAIREVSKASSEIARVEIERLEEALRASEKRYYDLVNERF